MPGTVAQKSVGAVDRQRQPDQAEGYGMGAGELLAEDHDADGQLKCRRQILHQTHGGQLQALGAQIEENQGQGCDDARDDGTRG